MTFYIYSPKWFSGIDSLLEIIIILTSFLISYYSFKTYKYFNFKKYKYFSLAFFFFGISFISKIISNLIILIPVYKQINFYFYSIVYESYKNFYLIENIFFFVHKLTLLLGLLILFFIITKEDKIETIILFVVFLIILSFLINNYLLFNFIIIVISLFLYLIDFINKKSIKKNKNSNLSIFFGGIFISYFLIFLAVKHNLFYSLGEIILSIIFFYMFLNLIKIFRK